MGIVLVQEHRHKNIAGRQETLPIAGVESPASKRIRRPSCAAMRVSADCQVTCHTGESQKYEKKRPTLRFSEMVRHDWTTFSRDKADSFDAVEAAVYSPWRQLCLTPSQLDHFGVSSDVVHGKSLTGAPVKSRKSSWYVTFGCFHKFHTEMPE